MQHVDTASLLTPDSRNDYIICTSATEVNGTQLSMTTTEHGQNCGLPVASVHFTSLSRDDLNWPKIILTLKATVT